MPKTRATVVIVGGGPVGLLTALRLGQAGIDTLVLEAHDSVLPATRAVV
jgi:2-polyprenyl-6-methoxyphenol hydroxylase-like FAD-dependent oxidoreductase